MIKLKTHHLENIHLCIMNFLDLTKPCSDLKCKENRQYDEHIQHKTQKCKGIYSTVLDEIIEIDSLYPADLKMLGAYSGLVDIFVNIYNVEARYAFFTCASFLIKITNTS